MKTILLSLLSIVVGLHGYAQCIASFNAVQTPAYNDLLLATFSDNSTYGSLINRQYVAATYNFGDGSSALASATSSHLYGAPGTYSIGLRIRKYDSLNVQICTDTTTQTVVIAYPPCGTIANVTGSSAGPTRHFTATTPATTVGMSYAWNFGDGSTLTTSSVTVSHTYSTTGFYNVSLIANSGSAYSYTTASYTYVGYLSFSCSNFHAGLGFYPNGNTAYVNDTSSSFSEVYKICSYDYGDGSSDTSSPTHTYTNTGLYTVRQKVSWYDSLTNIILCSDSATSLLHLSDEISGYVIYDTLAFPGIQSFKVYLIQYDSSTASLSAVDSVLASNSSFYTPYVPYNFTGVSGGNYLVKAARQNNIVGMAGLLPTYADSSLYWSSAQYVAAGNFPNYGRDIWMKSGVALAGPGFIGGNVTLGANKGAGTGVKDISILLRDHLNTVISSTVTDINGDFSFRNIPLGSYSIYPEQASYATTAAAVTVSTMAMSVYGLNFHQDDTKKTIAPHDLGLSKGPDAATDLSVFPNPANGLLNISCRNCPSRSASVIISDVSGRIVYQTLLQTDAATGKQVLDLRGLSSGLYFLTNSAAPLVKPLKVFIQ